MEQLETDRVPCDYSLQSSPISRAFHGILHRAATRVQISSVTKVLLRILLIILVVLLIVWVLFSMFAPPRQPTTPATIMPPLSIAIHLHPLNETSDSHENTTAVNTIATAVPTTNVLIAFGGGHDHQRAAFSLTIQNLDDGGKLLQTLVIPNSGLLRFDYTLHNNNNKIYVLDGWTARGSLGDDTCQQLYAFDLITRTWDRHFPQLPARSAGEVVLLSPGGDDDNLYAFGHNNNDHDGRTSEMFSFNVKQNLMWQNMNGGGVSQPPAPTADVWMLDICCSVTMNGTMYFLHDSGKLFAANDGGKRWKELSPLANPRNQPTCVALPSQQKIIVAGGRLLEDDTMFDSLEVYDAHADRWTLSTTLKLSRARYGLGSVVLPSARGETEDVLFCGGTNADYVPLDICEKLDWTNQRINTTFSMTIGRVAFRLVATTMTFI